MQKTVFLINGGKQTAISEGQLNKTLHEHAIQLLQTKYQIITTDLGLDNYVPATEANKFAQADFIIWQFPGWWMSTPWYVKKYIDEVFGKLGTNFYTGDGRSRQDPAKKYGSGGINQNKKYMFSSTWNAPSVVFNNHTQFFAGASFDQLFLWMHKAMEFVGLQALPSFYVNDVIKNPTIDAFLKAYADHLKVVFNL